MTDHLKLTVPARDEFARTVRLTAAALASRLDMSLDDVSDVRIAVEEAYLLVLACATPGDPVTFDFTLAPGEFSVDVGPLDVKSDSFLESPDVKYARFILEGVCDSFELADVGGSRRVRLTKRASR
ncbi:MAG: ATP-binding protein [Chloroflexota bacterium]